jgi:hypothetical protein
VSVSKIASTLVKKLARMIKSSAGSWEKRPVLLVSSVRVVRGQAASVLSWSRRTVLWKNIGRASSGLVAKP